MYYFLDIYQESVYIIINQRELWHLQNGKVPDLLICSELGVRSGRASEQ